MKSLPVRFHQENEAFANNSFRSEVALGISSKDFKAAAKQGGGRETEKQQLPA